VKRHVMDDRKTKTSLNREGLLLGKAQPDLSSSSLTAAEMVAAYGLLCAEVLQLRTQEQHLRDQLAIARGQEKAAQARLAELVKANDIMQRTVNRLAIEPNIDGFLGFLLYEIALKLGTDTAVITPYDPSTSQLRIAALFSDGQLTPLDPMLPALPDPDARFLERILSTQGFVVFDVEKDADLFWPGAVKFLQSRGKQKSVSFAIRLEDQFFGQISLAYEGDPNFDSEEAALVKALSTQAALAIQLTRLLEESRHAVILDERNRMAREIHDTLAQAFTSILMRLQTAELGLPDDLTITQNNLQLACDLARQGLAEARRSVHALRPHPLEQENFSTALKCCLRSLVSPSQLESEFCITGSPQPLPARLEDELLRIAQEAIANACKHAAARKIEVQLIFAPHKVCLMVRDNGQGFIFSDVTNHKGFGLISMQERAQKLGGKFCLSSQPGQGTEIVVEVELP
jgi:signal transduction histidine kinase